MTTTMSTVMQVQALATGMPSSFSIGFQERIAVQQIQKYSPAPSLDLPAKEW